MNVRLGDICLIWPVVLFSQFGGKLRNLGTYELEEDAACAFNKVARVLGRSGLDLNSGAVEIHGWSSEGSYKAVAAAVEDAKTFMAAGGSNQTYIAADACLLGNSMMLGLLGNISPKS